jgi:hypothetical protein
MYYENTTYSDEGDKLAQYTSPLLILLNAAVREKTG